MREVKPLNPYPGLRSFQVDEDVLFFGREEQTTELLERLDGSRFLAVVGTSGSGKSSLVRAGLVPALLRGALGSGGARWRVAIQRPAGAPVRRLAETLAVEFDDAKENSEVVVRLESTLRRSRRGLIEAFRQAQVAPNTRLLLVVDQFEELFRYGARDAARQDEVQAFVDLLLTAAADDDVPIYVIATLRSDWLGECAQVAGLAEAINRGEYLVPRLGRRQVRRAIEGPAKVAGGSVTKRFVQHVLNELGDDVDQLPVLQHALLRAWQVREEGAPLDLEHYEAIGGVSDALSRHADEVYFALPDDRTRDVARDVFQALTQVGEGGQGIRRPTRVGRLEAICRAEMHELSAVIDAFRAPGVSFVTPLSTVPLDGDPVVDISHESLMRGWSRLRGWVSEEAESARVYRRLAESASLWENGRAGLYRSPDLDVAETWRTPRLRQIRAGRVSTLPVTRRRSRFSMRAGRIAPSASARARPPARASSPRPANSRGQSRAKRRPTARTARNFRRFGLAMGVLAVIVLVLAVQAMRLWRDAEDSRVVAVASEARARHEQGVAWFEACADAAQRKAARGRRAPRGANTRF